MVSISFIIPTFNNLELLKRCIPSIESQLQSEDKIILVDDGSVDGTNEYLIANFTEKENFILLTQKNSGSGSARNLGMKNSNTDYIWFIDADDFLLDGAVDQVKEVLQTNGYDMLYIGYSVMVNHFKTEHREINYNPKDKVELMLTEHYPWNKIIKKACLQNIYFPDTNIRYQDQATIPVIIAKARNIGIIEGPLYLYDMSHTGNMSKKKCRNKDIYKAFQYLNEHYENNRLTREELEILYIKKFIFDEPYNVDVHFRDIYLNTKKVCQFLNSNIPEWRKSLLLKVNAISKYNHLMKFPVLKVFVGKVMWISPFIASILIYGFLLIKYVLFLGRNVRKGY